MVICQELPSHCISRLMPLVTIIPTIPLLATYCHSISGRIFIFMELCIMARGRAGQYHGFIQWAEQGGGGPHGDAGAEPQGSEVDVETRLAAVSQEPGGVWPWQGAAHHSIALWLTRRQRAGIIWSSTRRLQWRLSRSFNLTQGFNSDNVDRILPQQ